MELVHSQASKTKHLLCLFNYYATLLARYWEASCNVDTAEVLEGEIYNFDELNHIDVGVAPCSLKEDVSVIFTYNRHNYII